MSGKCSSCHCADNNQCTKKGNTLDIVQTEYSYTETLIMEVAENDGKCQCGPSCRCTNCSCGSH